MATKQSKTANPGTSHLLVKQHIIPDFPKKYTAPMNLIIERKIVAIIRAWKKRAVL